MWQSFVLSKEPKYAKKIILMGLGFPQDEFKICLLPPPTLLLEFLHQWPRPQNGALGTSRVQN